MRNLKTNKRIVDSKDREILRYMNNANRAVSGLSISKAISISPPAIKPRLNNLHKQGIIKPIKKGGERIFDRTFKNISKPITIKAPSKILWGLDIKKKRR